MRKADLVVSLSFMALGIIVVFDSVQLGFQWGGNGPESGFFPFYLGVGLIISSLLGRSSGNGDGGAHGICGAPRRRGPLSGILYARRGKDRVGNDGHGQYPRTGIALFHL
jgi:hypothetical protein